MLTQCKERFRRRECFVRFLEEREKRVTKDNIIAHRPVGLDPHNNRNECIKLKPTTFVITSNTDVKKLAYRIFFLNVYLLRTRSRARFL